MEVTKKRVAGSPGTRRLVEKYGAALVCVRYRVDRHAGKRYKTVELIIDELPALRGSPGRRRGPDEANRRDSGDVLVRIDFAEMELRARIKAAGGQWISAQKLWRIAYPNAVRVGVIDRIVRSA